MYNETAGKVLIGLGVVGVVVALVAMYGHISSLNELNSQLEADKSSLVSQRNQARVSYSKSEECHLLANDLTLTAEQLLVDAIAYGLDYQLQTDIEDYLNSADSYNAKCVEPAKVFQFR